MRVRLIAWGLCGLYVAISVGTLAVRGPDSSTLDLVLVPIAAGFAVVGALVADRQPGNRVGWLMLVIALAFAIQGFADIYVAVAGRPLAVLAAWVGNWAWYFWLYVAGLMLPLFFPTGRLLSSRWRLAVWSAATALGCSVLAGVLAPGVLDSESPVPLDNPVGLGAAAGPALRVVDTVGGVLAAVGVVASVASLVLRLRRSRGRERQQVALFAYVGALGLMGFGLAILGVAGESLNRKDPPTWALVAGNVGWFTALVLLTVGLPVAAGIAILRHRLYDIDVVIKRTLVYGSLTLMLGATYVVMVLVLRVLLDPLTGESDLAVAASTLAVAAIFRPLRSRVQRAVDRRFYRRRYDAAYTVDAFAERLRQEVDLGAVSVDLQSVADATMQPTQVSLWLRPMR